MQTIRHSRWPVPRSLSAETAPAAGQSAPSLGAALSKGTRRPGSAQAAERRRRSIADPSTIGSSGSMRADSAVEPTRSENITVTWRRSATSCGFASPSLLSIKTTAPA